MVRIILRGVIILFWVVVFLAWPNRATASPFGQGIFGADVPFGSATSMSIALGGNVSLPLTSNGSNFVGSGSHSVTVTSTDVVGYRLYVNATSATNMVNGSATITASANGTASPLTASTWGYNTTGSTTNFLGLPVGGALLKNASGPFKNGDTTTITYGALTSLTQPAGTYTIAITYTTVATNP